MLLLLSCSRVPENGIKTGNCIRRIHYQSGALFPDERSIIGYGKTLKITKVYNFGFIAEYHENMERHIQESGNIAYHSIVKEIYRTDKQLKEYEFIDCESIYYHD